MSTVLLIVKWRNNIFNILSVNPLLTVTVPKYQVCTQTFILVTVTNIIFYESIEDNAIHEFHMRGINKMSFLYQQYLPGYCFFMWLFYRWLGREYNET